MYSHHQKNSQANPRPSSHKDIDLGVPTRPLRFYLRGFGMGYGQESVWGSKCDSLFLALVFSSENNFSFEPGLNK